MLFIRLRYSTFSGGQTSTLS